MMMKKALLLFCAAFSLLAVPQAIVAAASEQDDFCIALREVLGQTKDDFARFKGRPVDEQTWAPKRILPGQHACTIHRTAKSTSYVCESEPLTAQEAAAAASTLNQQRARECLGPQWKQSNAFSESFTSLRDDEAEQTIMFSVEQINPVPEFVATMSVQRMFQRPLERPASSATSLLQDDYCPDLQRVVRSSRQNFAEVTADVPPQNMGSRVHWRSNTQLAGWSTCYVHGDPDKPQCRYLACSVGPMPAQRDAEQLRDKTTGEIKACLGAGWLASKTRNANGIMAGRVLKDADDPYIEVSPSKSLYGETWTLDLAVRLPHCD